MVEKNPDEHGRRSTALHQAHRGKLGTFSKVPLDGTDDLSLAYTPGVGAVCDAIARSPDRLGDLTVTGNAVAVVTDGSAVLGLGDIGPRAAMPVMEGKCVLFKKLADLDAWPLCLDVRGVEEIVAAIAAVAPGFAGVNLEDIAAPRCFEIEDRLQDLGIPVMHDDQHGTAVVVLAGLMNAVRVTGKRWSELRVVIAGAGAAGRAITRLLACQNQDTAFCNPLGELIVCDSKGILHRGRSDLDAIKREMLAYSNPQDRQGDLCDALVDADVFIGVSRGDLLAGEDVGRMAPDPIVFALSNPVPEIMPEAAREAGAAVVATGRSDFANQVNNVLVFPGIFRGALDAKARRITDKMKMAAAAAIASATEEVGASNILPSPLSPHVVPAVASAVAESADTT